MAIMFDHSQKVRNITEKNKVHTNTDCAHADEQQ